MYHVQWGPMGVIPKKPGKWHLILDLFAPQGWRIDDDTYQSCLPCDIHL